MLLVVGIVTLLGVREGCDERDREKNDHAADDDQVRNRDENEAPVKVSCRRVHTFLPYDPRPQFEPAAKECQQGLKTLPSRDQAPMSPMPYGRRRRSRRPVDLVHEPSKSSIKPRKRPKSQEETS